MGGPKPSLASTVLAIALLTTGVMALALPGAAQSPIQAQAILQAEPGPDTYTPGGAPAGSSWTLTVQTNAPPAESFTVNLAPTNVPEHWNVTLKPASVTFNPTENPDPESPQTFTASGNYTAQASANAPAFHAQSISLQPAFEETTTMETQGLATDITVIPGFRPEANLTAQPVTAGLSPNGGTTTLTATLTNDGNGQARFDPTQLEAPDGCTATSLLPTRTQAEQALTPPPDQTGSHWTVDPGHDTTIEIKVGCGFGYDEGALTLQASHTYAPDTEREGDPVQAQWQLQHDGFGGWGLIGLLLVLAAILAAAGYVAHDRETGESLQAWAQRKQEHIRS